jgi:hypothetical protein
MCVSRPSRWESPFEWTRLSAGKAEAVRLFRAYAEEKARADPSWLAPLRGLDLGRYCSLDEPCHADVLIELANR